MGIRLRYGWGGNALLGFPEERTNVDGWYECKLRGHTVRVCYRWPSSPYPAEFRIIGFIGVTPGMMANLHINCDNLLQVKAVLYHIQQKLDAGEIDEILTSNP